MENIIKETEITKEKLLRYRAQNPKKYAVKFAGVDVDAMEDGETLTRVTNTYGVVTNVIAKPEAVEEIEENARDKETTEETKPVEDKPKAKTTKTK